MYEDDDSYGAPDPVIRQIARDESLTLDQRLLKLEEMYPSANGADRIEIESYTEQLVLRKEARKEHGGD